MARYLRGSLFAAALVLAGCATVPPQSPGHATDAMPGPAEAPSPDRTSETEPALPDVAVIPAERRALALGEFAERNDEKLLQVYVGMSRRSVEQLMQSVGTGPYANPFRRQMLSDAHGERYEVLYFLTRTPVGGRRVSENQLTPVIFRDDRVVAIGRFPLKKLRRGECPGRKSTCPQ